MPDMHLGKGACVGCVVPTVGAIIPSAVGVVWSRFDNCNFCPVINTVFTQLYGTLDIMIMLQMEAKIPKNATLE